MFVIDCGPEMFVPNEELSRHLKAEEDTDNKICAFQAALKCISSVMKNKIICSETDKLGVLCYGTGKSKNPAGFPHIYLLQDLEVPDAPSILEIERYFESPDAFLARFGSAEGKEFPFGNVFWSAANVFSEKRFSGLNKRIFLFTCEDCPNAANESLQRAAKIRGKDLAQLGITLELFSLPRSQGKKKFKLGSFYASILPGDQVMEESLTAADEGHVISGKFDELLAQVRRRQVRKRALARTQMSLGPNMNLSIKLFSLYMETKKGQYVWTNERSGQVMIPKTEWKCKETGKSLQAADFKFSFDYGGEQVSKLLDVFFAHPLDCLYTRRIETNVQVRQRTGS